MKTFILTIALMLLLSLTAQATPGDVCHWNSQCSPGEVCLIPDGSQVGKCVIIGH